jgi:hypothetical protein
MVISVAEDAIYRWAQRWNEERSVEDRDRSGRPPALGCIESVDRYLTRNLCTILAVALNRLQHCVKAHLASVAYLK